MLKQITSALLVLIIVFSLAGCAQPSIGSEGNNNAGSSSPSTGESTGIQNGDTSETPQIVELTLPAMLFEGEDMSNFDTEKYAEEQGLISAKVNEDRSMTVTMTKEKHEKFLADLSATVEATFADQIGDELSPYIKDITHNDNFTSVVVKVDRAAYENAFDITPFTIALSVAMYQAFANMEFYVEVDIVDVATGETIKTVTYPDALEG